MIMIGCLFIILYCNKDSLGGTYRYSNISHCPATGEGKMEMLLHILLHWVGMLSNLLIKLSSIDSDDWFVLENVESRRLVDFVA